MLPCADIDEVGAFFTRIGFEVTHRQLRPSPYLALAGHGFDLHYYGMPGHDPETTHSTCGVVVDDPHAIWESFATGLRESGGVVPITGTPRLTRPRPRKNAGGHTGFSLVDPAGNWIRFFRGAGPDEPAAPTTRLGDALANAVVLADSKGDVPQATKILEGAVRRATPDDPSWADAQEFLDELRARA